MVWGFVFSARKVGPQLRILIWVRQRRDVGTKPPPIKGDLVGIVATYKKGPGEQIHPVC